MTDTQLSSIVQLLTKESDNFEAGRLAKYTANWAMFTSDSEILKIVTGAEIDTGCEFEELANLSNPSSQSLRMNTAEAAIIDEEISKLLKKKVITQCQHTQGEVFSLIFTRQKKSWITELNEEVTFHHLNSIPTYSCCVSFSPNPLREHTGARHSLPTYGFWCF